jgi:hypothetical protein
VLPAPPSGAARLDLDFDFIDDEYSVTYWMYAPSFQTDQAGAITWLESIFHPYFIDVLQNNLSSLLTLRAYRLTSYGSAFWRVDEPVTPISGTIGPTCPAHSCVNLLVGGAGAGRRGHSIQHFPGLFAGNVSGGKYLTDTAWSQLSHDAGALFNGAFSPSPSTSPSYLATLSRVSGGVPRPSSLLIPAISYGPSRRVGTMRRRMRT